MASYTNIKDILREFELQVVQKKHYKKDEVYTKSQANNAISNAVNTAIAGVNQFNVIVSSNAANTPKGVEWTSDSTTITGTLEATSADAHTVYYVKSFNGTNDSYDEYMAVSGVWEKLGNTDVDLTDYSTRGETVSSIHFDDTDGLYYIYANEHIAIDKHKLGSAAEWRTFLGATNTASNLSAGLATPKMVYNLQEKPIGSSSAGVALSGTVGAPTIKVSGGSVANNVGNVVTGGTVYTYITTNCQPKDADLTAIAALTGTSGFLKKTAADTWALDTSTYLTTSDAVNKYLTMTAASAIYLSKDDATDTYLSLTAAGNTYAQRTETIRHINFDSTKGLRYQTVEDFGNVSNQAFTTVASISTLKSALLSISDDDFTAILNAV